MFYIFEQNRNHSVVVTVKPADCHTTRGGGVDACLIHSRSYHFFGKLNEHWTRLVIGNETQEKNSALNQNSDAILGRLSAWRFPRPRVSCCSRLKLESGAGLGNPHRSHRTPTALKCCRLCHFGGFFRLCGLQGNFLERILEVIASIISDTYLPSAFICA